MAQNPSRSSHHWIAGKRCALVGKLGGVTRREAAQLIRRLEGVLVERPDEAELIVIGADEASAAPLAALVGETAAARIAAGTAELLTETQLWQRLGLVQADPDVQQLFTPASLARLISVDIGAIRRWHRRGLLTAVREVHRLPYFDFAEVAVARRLAELAAAGVSTADIERAIVKLKRRLPHAELAELPTVVEGKQLLLWHNDELFETSGQQRFDFQAQDEPRAATAGAFADRPHSPEQLLALASHCEEAGELKQAADLYRAALAAGGPRPEVCFLLAELLYRTGNLAAARERYSMAIELDEDFVEARANLGCVLAELGERELAQAALSGALALHPDYADAHFHLAKLLEEEGRADEAALHWQRFLELAPHSPWSDEARNRRG